METLCTGYFRELQATWPKESGNLAIRFLVGKFRKGNLA
jgi:hypothetical protein